MKRAYLFNLPFPPSLNHMFPSSKAGRRHLSARGKEYRTSVLAAVLEQHGLIQPLTGPLKVTIELFPPDKRRRDIDNFDGKAIFDSLQNANVFEDDSQIKERHSYMRQPGKDSCAVVIVEES